MRTGDQIRAERLCDTQQIKDFLKYEHNNLKPLINSILLYSFFIKQSHMASLYQRLGGEPAISAVVDKFYDHMLKDERVLAFFKNTDMERQRKQQKSFITLVTGGPNHYDGKDMKEAHAKFAIRKLEFDATWENLELAMKHFSVSQELINQVKEIFYSTEEDIVNTK